MITKGAVDVLLERCEKIYQNGEVKNLTQLDKEMILRKNSDMADRALRVLAVSYRETEKVPKENVEQNLIFVRISAE